MILFVYFRGYNERVASDSIKTAFFTIGISANFDIPKRFPKRCIYTSIQREERAVLNGREKYHISNSRPSQNFTFTDYGVVRKSTEPSNLFIRLNLFFFFFFVNWTQKTRVKTVYTNRFQDFPSECEQCDMFSFQ